MTKQVILFNGPPGSGKDECTSMAVHYLLNEKNLPAYSLMFKEQLFRLVLTIFNVSREEFFALYDNRETKEKPTCLLYGYSPRQAMIFVSETVIKPNFGKYYFGNIAAERVQHGINVFSDSGFLEELEPVYEEAEGLVTIVRVHRPGYTFEGDSRSYLEGYKRSKVVDLNNEGSLDDLRNKVVKLVDEAIE